MDLKIEEKVVSTMNPIQKIILYLLQSKKREPVRGKLWLQKEMFLISKNIPYLEEECDFSPHLKGPFSEDLDEFLNQLKNAGLVEIQGYEGQIRLSEFGEKIAKEVEKEIPKNWREIVDEMKSFLNDLSESELLAYIYYSYPEMTKKSVVKKRIGDRKDAAIRLYRKGKVSLSKASEIAGVSIEDFIKEARSKSIEVYSE